MPTEAVIYLKRYDLKNVKQVLCRPMTLLVTSFTIGQLLRIGLHH